MMLNTIFSSRVLILFLFTGLGVPLVALSQSDSEVDSKQIRIESGGDSGLEVLVRGIQEDYAVGEPIEFEVEGNRTYFLWVYATDPAGDAVLLVPSSLQKYNKYTGGRAHRVPNRPLEFAGDVSGPHTLTLVASTRWLDVDVSGGGPRKGMELDQAFSSKGIQIRRGDGDTAVQGDANTVIRQIPIQVTGRQAAVNPEPSSAMTFVRLDRDQYQLGERFQMIFGATEDGFVQVMVREPGGDLVQMLEQEVTANQVYQEQGTITDPVGAHAMLAFFSEESSVDTGTMSKGVVLDRSAPEPSSEYRFEVVR